MNGQGKPSGPKRPHAPLNMVPVYKTLEELKASSPSRAHGLSEEDEERWRRAAINLMVTAGLTIRMDHCAVLTGLEFFHRFYAEHSMVTNDRFLMAMACMYLGAKIADFPKSSRDIIYGCVDAMCTTHEESSRLRNDSEWMKQTRQAINDAERALLYHLGFRFSWKPAPFTVINILKDKTSGGIGTFLDGYFENKPEEERGVLSTMCVHLANESAKIPLNLQYPPEAIAAVCIWLGMKLFKVTATPPALFDPKTGKAKQWYHMYGVENKDLEIIADQITGSVVGDAEAAHEIISGAVRVVKTEFINLNSNQQSGGGLLAPPPASAVGR